MVKKKKDENIPKVKVVRDDVKQRKEDNKNTDFTCIKSSFTCTSIRRYNKTVFYFVFVSLR